MLCHAISDMLTVVPERAMFAVYGIFDRSVRPKRIVRRSYYAADVLAGLSEIHFVSDGGLSIQYRDADGNIRSEVVAIRDAKPLYGRTPPSNDGAR